MHTFPECPEMAPEDEKDLIEAVVTCEGNLHDPDFSARFQILLGNLKSILYPSKEEELLKVKKIEPWNSVRVTISIPKEAAQKLRLLAQQGSTVLRSLGILTVQVEGDQVISLTLAGQNNEPTEIVLRQSDGPSTSSSTPEGSVGVPTLPCAPTGPMAILSATSSTSSAFIRSPNVVAPAGEWLPVLPPKPVSSSTNPRPSAAAGQFPFTSMIHAAQTMQRTDPALQQQNSNNNNSSSSSSSNLSNNNNVNENAVNSTNFPSSVPSSTSLPSPAPVTQTQIQVPQSSYSAPPPVIVNSVAVSNSNSTTLMTQQQQQIQGHVVVKSEQVSRFVQQQIGRGGPGGASQGSPHSQSLQLQIVNVNAPPPYPGVNSSSSVNISSNNNSNVNIISSPSGNLNSFNHQHHQYHQELNSANSNSMNYNNNNVNVVSTLISQQPSTMTYVGAPPPSSTSSNVTLVRSVSSPSMSSQLSQPHHLTHQILGDNNNILIQQQPHNQQQPMSSPLLVNLLQNNESPSPSSQNQNPHQQLLQLGQGQQHSMMAMLPPASADHQKRFILHHQQQQQRKLKRGLSLDGATVGQGGEPAINKSRDLISPLIATGTGGESDPLGGSAVSVVTNASGSSSTDSNVFSQFTLPSSSSSVSSLPSNIPVSVSQLQAELGGTTATIIQGRTIIHQGNVRVFNSGQIRAIRLTQANTTTASSASSQNTIHFIQGKPLMTGSDENCVVLNGPHPVMTPSPSPLQMSGHQQQQFKASSSIQHQQLQQSETQESNVLASTSTTIRSVDQSFRTSFVNPPSTKTVVSTSSASGNLSSNNSNIFIPPSQPLPLSSSPSLSLSQSHQQQRLANANMSNQSVTLPQQRRNVVQSPHEAKSTPSQHQQHQQRGLTLLKSSKEPTLPPHQSSAAQLTSSGKPRQLLINPLTGHLEPMPSESSSESEDEEDHVNRRRPQHHQRERLKGKGLGNSSRGGTIQHRQILATTTTGVTVARVVKSSSLDSQQQQRSGNQQQQKVVAVPVTVVNANPPIGMFKKSKSDEAAKEDKEDNIVAGGPPGEKIKLRLKLEKNEPISPAYKVDVSFMKKSEKSSISMSALGSISSATNAPVGSPGPGEQPRVPPLHISLRGKNAAVVVSSPRREDNKGGDNEDNSSTTSFPSFYDGKLVPSNTSTKVGKRTKNRVKSSGCESEPESFRNLSAKHPAKVSSRPRLSKDSSPSILNASLVDGFVVNSADSSDTLKARLLDSTPVPISISSHNHPPLIITPVSVTVTGNIDKDLISSSSLMAVSGANCSTSPGPNVKLKKSRRKSETEMINRLLAPPPSLSAPFSAAAAAVPIESPVGVVVRSLTNITEDVISEDSSPPSSSLLFKHLSKKEDVSSVIVSQTVTTTTTASSTSLTPISLHACVKETMDQMLGTVTTTSVLTLTSTTTGASLTTVSQGVRVTAISSKQPISSPLPSLVADVGNKAVVVASEVSKDPNTLSITSVDEFSEEQIIPMLNRENIPKELDLAGTRTNSVVTGIPEVRTSITPTSKSPKPLPNLLTLPSKMSDEKLDASLQQTPSQPHSQNPPISSGTPLPPTNVTINKITIQAAPVTSNPLKIQSTPTFPHSEKSVSAQLTMPIVPLSLKPQLPILTEEKISTPTATTSKSIPPSSAGSVLIKKSEKVPITVGASGGIVKVKGSVSTILRPKVQTPRVSIGTSIDADLPALTPSPSLRELLEKEKSFDLKKNPIKPISAASTVKSDTIKTVTEDHQKVSVGVGESELILKPVIEMEKAQMGSIDMDIPLAMEMMEGKCDNRTADRTESQSQILIPVESIPAGSVPSETVNAHVDSDVKTEEVVVFTSASEILELSEPLPSTVTPNAPVPFPLILLPAKGDDPNNGGSSGVHGEDSGIDSMDALSEKSPNQGESPARKEIEQFGESQHQQNIPQHYDPLVAPQVIHHQEQAKQVLATLFVKNKVDLPPQPQESVSVVTKNDEESDKTKPDLPSGLVTVPEIRSNITTLQVKDAEAPSRDLSSVMPEEGGCVGHISKYPPIDEIQSNSTISIAICDHKHKLSVKMTDKSDANLVEPIPSPRQIPDPTVEEPPFKRIKTELENPPDVSKEAMISERQAVPTVIERVGTPSAEQRIPPGEEGNDIRIATGAGQRSMISYIKLQQEKSTADLEQTGQGSLSLKQINPIGIESEVTKKPLNLGEADQKNINSLEPETLVPDKYTSIPIEETESKFFQPEGTVVHEISEKPTGEDTTYRTDSLDKADLTASVVNESEGAESLVTEIPESLTKTSGTFPEIQEELPLSLPKLKPISVEPVVSHSSVNIPDRDPEISIVTTLKEPVVDEIKGVDEYGSENKLESNEVPPPVVIVNHVDAIQELNQHFKLQHQQQTQVVLKKDNVKVRKLKLENIVAAIGTKNIERQQQAKEPFDLSIRIEDEGELQQLTKMYSEGTPVHSNVFEKDNKIETTNVVPNAEFTQGISVSSEKELAVSVMLNPHVSDMDGFKVKDTLVISPVSKEEVSAQSKPTTSLEIAPEAAEVRIVNLLAVESLLPLPEQKEPPPTELVQLKPGNVERSLPKMSNQEPDLHNSFPPSISSESRKKKIIDQSQVLEEVEESRKIVIPSEKLNVNVSPSSPSLPTQELEIVTTKPNVISEVGLPQAIIVGSQPASHPVGEIIVKKSHVQQGEKLLPKMPEIQKKPVVNHVSNLEMKITQKLIDPPPLTNSKSHLSPASVPPPISIVLPARTNAGSVQKPVLMPQKTHTPRHKSSRAKVKPGQASPGGRRILDGPPKLSKATETDPRPESANPPRLEMRRFEEPNVKLQQHGNPSLLPTLSMPSNVNPSKIQIHTVAPQQPSGGGNVSLASLATAHRSIPSMVQLTKSATLTHTQAGTMNMNMVPISTASSIHQGTAVPANAISTASLSALAALPSLQASPISTTGGPATGQMVFAIHPNVTLPANLSHLPSLQSLQSHAGSGITVLPGGHKMVPIKLVTIPKQSSGQFQTIASTGRGGNRGSPNIMEAVNIVANAGSRSNSPKTIITGNSIQGGATTLNSLNLSSLAAGGGGIHLVPISMASAVGGGTASPVKVIVSTPIKMQQSMMMKSMGQQGATIRVVRPMVTVHKPVERIQSAQVQDGLIRQTNTNADILPQQPFTLINAPPILNPSVVNTPIKSKIVVEKKELEAVNKVSESIYKHVDGLEILDSALPQMNEDDLPFEADIIHDEKDLEDVLAGESFETVVRENGIDGMHSSSPSDEELERVVKKTTTGAGSNSTKKSYAIIDKSSMGSTNDQFSDETSPTPDSPILVMRSSPPFFTYGNRSSAKNSRPSTRSPSPTDEDVLHGEDQEIIDSFTRSPSQPKLSPQNRPDDFERGDGDDEEDFIGSPRKPDLTADHIGTLNQELSIEIPPVDLMVMSPSHQHQQHTEERKSTRSTRSNTRLVSPDITAFRSDTPKPAKFSSKPADPLVFKNSPKPSPTGSLKMLSPNVSGLAITPSSSNRSSPILPNLLSGNIEKQQHPMNSLASGAMEKIGANNFNSTVSGTNSSKVNRGVGNKRKRQESDSSNASKDENNVEEKVEIDLNSRPGKRRCSENAAELIKVCIGIEDTPKRNSMLIKKMEESKLKEAKMKKAMATLVEENEGDTESVESSISRGKGGRSSRASSEDRSSSRGSSVQRNSGSSKSSSKDEDHLKEQKTTSKANNRAGKEKLKGSSGRNSPNQNATGELTNKKVLKSGGTGRRSNRGALARDKSPLTPAKTRTNVRKEIGSSTIGSEKLTGGAPTTGGTTTTSLPETENLRRKTRSCAAADTPDSDLAAMKRRRVSKDTKS